MAVQIIPQEKGKTELFGDLFNSILSGYTKGKQLKRQWKQEDEDRALRIWQMAQQSGLSELLQTPYAKNILGRAGMTGVNLPRELTSSEVISGAPSGYDPSFQLDPYGRIKGYNLKKRNIYDEWIEAGMPEGDIITWLKTRGAGTSASPSGAGISQVSPTDRVFPGAGEAQTTSPFPPAPGLMDGVASLADNWLRGPGIVGDEFAPVKTTEKSPNILNILNQFMLRRKPAYTGFGGGWPATTAPKAGRRTGIASPQRPSQQINVPDKETFIQTVSQLKAAGKMEEARKYYDTWVKKIQWQ